MDLFEVTTTMYPFSTLDSNWTLQIENNTLEPSPVMITSQALHITRFVVQRILAPILVIGGVIGNGFNIAVLRSPKMRSSTNVYLTALAVCDSLYLIFMIALSFVSCEYSYQSKFLFYFIPYGRVFSDMFGNTAVWLTVAFTLERYVGVCHPMKGKAWCTIRKAKIAVVCVTLVCISTTVPEFLELEIVEEKPSSALETTLLKCQTTEFGRSEQYQIGYFWWYVTFFTIIPLILLSVLNSMLIRSVWRASKARRTLSNSSVVGETTRQATEQQKVTTMLISVVLIFLFCQFPWTILLLYKASMSAYDMPMPRDAIRIAGNVCNLLVEFNASVNFLLYSYFSSRFRRTFKRLVCGHCQKDVIKSRKSTLSSSSDTFRKSSMRTSCRESITTTSVASCRSKRNIVHDASVKESLLQKKQDI